MGIIGEMGGEVQTRGRGDTGTRGRRASHRVSASPSPRVSPLRARGRDVVLHALLGFADLRDEIVEVRGPVDEIDLVGVDD